MRWDMTILGIEPEKHMPVMLIPNITVCSQFFGLVLQSFGLETNCTDSFTKNTRVSTKKMTCAAASAELHSESNLREWCVEFVSGARALKQACIEGSVELGGVLTVKMSVRF